MTLPDVATSVAWMRDGTGFLLDRLDDADLAATSGLPGWTNGHVAAHIARNADALLRLLHWARTGEPTPMYASSAARNEEIERDAAREPQVHRVDVRTTAAALDLAIATTDADTWTVQIRSTRRAITAGEVPWMRAKEVWLHAVDLGASSERIPFDVATALIDDIAGSFSNRDDAPAMQLIDTESGRAVDIGHGGPTVSGAARDLAVWLAGRGTGAGLQCPDDLPALPAWL